MVEVIQTDAFETWLDNLRDPRAQAQISKRIVRVQSGLSGDVKSVGDGVSELRIQYGPGYRLYFVQQQQVVIILLCGGNKDTQARDIARAKKIAKEV